jgi:hypothetical protein
MRRIIAATLVSVLFCSTVCADYDAAGEARAAAQRAAAAEAAAKQQAEAQAMKNAVAANANSQMNAHLRDSMGASAAGKSDAELMKTYQQQANAASANAMKGMAEAQKGMNNPESQAALKEITGKSMAELGNMSDAEAEALAAELEKKYGAGK